VFKITVVIPPRPAQRPYPDRPLHAAAVPPARRSLNCPLAAARNPSRDRPPSAQRSPRGNPDRRPSAAIAARPLNDRPVRPGTDRRPAVQRSGASPTGASASARPDGLRRPVIVSWYIIGSLVHW